MIHYDDKFYQDETDLAIFIGHEDLSKMEEGFLLTYDYCELRPIEQFDGWSIADRVDDERFSEDNDADERDRIAQILNENVDWDKINELIPKLWYPSKRKGEVTREELLRNFPF